nr:RecName: Full=Glyceraldehyde-3-phosphate dehydrogenase; Short=GAPH [Chattonella marina var. antiqua]
EGDVIATGINGFGRIG